MKRTINKLALAVVCLASLISMGCSGGDSFGLAPVTGIVTLDGEPIEGVGVTFTPMATEDTAIVGPFSYATTDAAGKFTMKSKQGNPGAVVGKHSIECQLESFDRDAVEALMERMDQAKRNGDDISKFQAKIEAAKNQKQIPQDFSLEIEVPKAGLTDYKIDITSN